MGQPLIPPHSERFRLTDYDPGYTGGMSKEEGRERIVGLRQQLNELQDLLYADGRYGVLIVLQAIDTGGKDGTIRSVFRDVGPLGCSVVSFGVPSAAEMAHDYLWRYHQRTPARREMVIFNRSHYESVLVERVKGIAPREVYEKRYEHLNDFEERLADEGTVILKFFLHISKDEQRERLQERVDRPDKRWKFHASDIEERKRWDLYQEAFQEMVARCNTKAAPWHVVPANRKWYRDVVVAEAIVERLEGLGLRYPEADPGIEGTVVE